LPEKHNGYIRYVVDHSQPRSDYVAVTTVLDTKYDTKVLKTERIVKSGDSLAYYR